MKTPRRCLPLVAAAAAGLLLAGPAHARAPHMAHGGDGEHGHMRGGAAYHAQPHGGGEADKRARGGAGAKVGERGEGGGLVGCPCVCML